MSARRLAIPSTGDATAPVSRASTVCSNTSNDSFETITLFNPHSQTVEVAAHPDFYIFTSLLWTRRFNDTLYNTYPSEKDARAATLDTSKPDLGIFQYHLDRLVAAGEALQWRHIRALKEPGNGLAILRTSIQLYLQCLPAVPPHRVERRKLRIVINKLGAIRVESTVMDCLNVKYYELLARNFIPLSLHSIRSDKVGVHSNENSDLDDEYSQVLIDTEPTRPSLFTTHKTSYRIAYDSARARANIVKAAPTEKEVLLYSKNGEVMEASLSTVYFLRHGTWITPATICGGNIGVTRRMALERGLCGSGTVDVAELQDGEKIWLSNGARGFFRGKIILRRRNLRVARGTRGNI